MKGLSRTKNWYETDLTSKPLSNYYEFFKISTFEKYNSQWFWHSFACFVQKIVKNQTFEI